jgi:hypothetical protein
MNVGSSDVLYVADFFIHLQHCHDCDYAGSEKNLIFIRLMLKMLKLFENLSS